MSAGREERTAVARAGRLLGAIAAVGGALLLAACGGPAPQVQQTEATATGDPGAAYTVTWGQCARSPLELEPGVECGSMTLPVDWARPDGETFTTTVYRKKADGPSRGTFLNFPGGPGLTADIGFGAIAEFAPGYDLIGIDPRGVSGDGAVVCDVRETLRLPIVPPEEESPFAGFAAASARFLSSCATRPPGLQSHLDAYSDARDADALRSALGIERVGVYGFSYGSLLGARYAELFGSRVTATVLEGVLNPQQSATEFETVAARGAQQIFDAFADWCSTDEECAPLGNDAPGALRRAIGNVEAGRVPGTTPSGRAWEPAAVAQLIEGTIGTGDFAAAVAPLADLSGDDPRGFDEGTAEEDASSLWFFPDRIVCSDFDLRVSSAEGMRTLLAQTTAVAPDVRVSAESAGYLATCATGPGPSPEAGAPVATTTARPVLLVSNRLDPSTPREWADQVAAQLGTKAQHIVADLIGHGGTLGEPDVLAAVTAYVDAAAG